MAAMRDQAKRALRLRPRTARTAAGFRPLRGAARLAAVLALAAAAGGQAPVDPGTAAAWRERLGFPEVRFDFQLSLSVDDLLGLSALDPDERLARAEAGAEDDPDDVEAGLELVHALLAVGDRDEAEAALEQLRERVGRRLAADREDWPAVAAMGRIAATHGLAFRRTDALRSAEVMLQASFANDDSLWRAPTTLASFYTWLATRAAAAGDVEEAGRMLAAAEELAGRAVVAAPDELRPHAVLFLARTWDAVVGSAGDPDRLLARSLEAVDALAAESGLGDDPAQVEGLAELVAATAFLGVCLGADDPREAFDELGDERRARALACLDALAPVGGHRVYGQKARQSRWLLAWLARDPDAEELFEEAVDSERAADVLTLRLGLEQLVGEPEVVAAVAERLLEARDDARARLAVGYASARLGDLAAAEAHFAAALEHDPDADEARVGRAVARLRLGGDEEAARETLRAFLADASDDHPARAPALFALGTALALEGNLEEALAWLEQADEAAPRRSADDVRATLEEVRALAGERDG